jgi:hypothetical protein
MTPKDYFVTATVDGEDVLPDGFSYFGTRDRITGYCEGLADGLMGSHHVRRVVVYAKSGGEYVESIREAS